MESPDNSIRSVHGVVPGGPGGSLMPPITTIPFGEGTIADWSRLNGSLGPKRKRASKFLKRMKYQTLKKVGVYSKWWILERIT